MNERPPLRFRADGTFQIMQISDVQDCNGLMKRTRRLMETALDRVKPDFVIFTGDQIKGYEFSLIFGSPASRKRQIESTIDEIVEILTVRQIPFTITFGNHDHDAPMHGDDQVAYYQRSPLCLTQPSEPGVPGFANHMIPVRSSDSETAALLLYCLDSHGSRGFARYLPLRPEQIDWYRRTRDLWIERNGGEVLPSLLFQHIPVEEVNELYKAVPGSTPGVFEGTHKLKGKYFLLDETKVQPGDFSGEMPKNPAHNAGLFDAALEKGDICGMFFGHDHTNGFHGDVRGIQLGHTPSAGYNSYGPGRLRGVRVFQFQEQAVRAFTSYVLTDEQLLDDSAEKIRWFTQMRDKTPTSFGAARPLLRKSALITSVGSLIVTATFAAGKLLGPSKKKKHKKNKNKK